MKETFTVGQKVAVAATNGATLDAEVLAINARSGNAQLKIDGRYGTCWVPLSRIELRKARA